ncbi:HAD family hydrolase [Bifidobacterium leontopitheci]|uniref:Haloacid dehalogenase-like hydrolase n=1 Tax=Bifidobacterium leontopitheci TaxID=2650774 RepID=A0A6I1GJP9_9BIFI|nr:HAD family hydrolase [Bifidobacterium leontopitheci]KAB7789629.1 Haloacid dehalogenase-like hydrolase [Bifidobacterium leontopitheci]
MTASTRRYDAVFFDLYGTLIDIRTDEEADEPWQALREALVGLGMEPAVSIAGLRARFTQAVRETNARQQAVRSSSIHSPRTAHAHADAVPLSADTQSDGTPTSAAARSAMTATLDGRRPVIPPDCVEPDLLPAYRLLCEAAMRGTIADRTSGTPAAAAIDRVAIDRAARHAAWTFRRASTRTIRLYPGAIRLLRSLHAAGLRVVLVSNAQACYTRPELDMLGLTPLFDRIVISSEEGVRKPSPELFHRALAREGLRPDRVVMVGNDERSDILGSRAAGIDGVYLRTAISPAGDPQSSAHAVLSLRGADYAPLAALLGVDYARLATPPTLLGVRGGGD